MDMVRVNFNHPLPLMPLPGVVLLPHSQLPLHIFEPRYRQMINRTLDEAGQFAIAVFADESWKDNYDGNPPVKPVVCIAQIVQHQSLPQGRYTVLVRGICRARIVEEIFPSDGRLYREARLAPIEPEPIEDESLVDVRETMKHIVSADEFDHLASVNALRSYINNDEIPTAALLDVVGVALLNDPIRKYKLLSSADTRERSDFILKELTELRQLIHKAELQGSETWPKGVSPN